MKLTKPILGIIYHQLASTNHKQTVMLGFSASAFRHTLVYCLISYRIHQLQKQKADLHIKYDWLEYV